MDSYIVGAMLIKLVNDGHWNLESLASQLNCNSQLLLKCMRGTYVARYKIQDLAYRLAQIYCATFK